MSSEGEGRLDTQRLEKNETASQAKSNPKQTLVPKTVTFAEESHIWTEAGLDQGKSSSGTEQPLDKQLKQENGHHLEQPKQERNELTESHIIHREVNQTAANGTSQSGKSAGFSPNHPTTEDRTNMMDIGSRLPDINIKEVTPFDRGSIHVVKALTNQTQPTGVEAPRERAISPADGLEVVTQQAEGGRSKTPVAQASSASNVLGKSQPSPKQIVRFHIVADIYPAQKKLLRFRDEPSFDDYGERDRDPDDQEEQQRIRGLPVF